jgi:hypothetical protein
VPILSTPRRPIRAVSAAAAAILAAALGAVAVPGAANASTASDFKLTFTSTSSAASTVQLDAANMTAILGDGNYTLQTGTTTSACHNAVGTAIVEFWCFDPADTSSTAWTPQGLTTTADEEADAAWNDIPGAMISWYHAVDSDSKGARVSVLNLDSHKYRNILLAEPTGSAADHDFAPLVYGSGKPVHAGGVMWYGRNLYVADTNWGIRVFSMDDIYQVPGSPAGAPAGCGWIGLKDGKYCASGYKYVMVQSGFWKTATASVTANFCTGKAASPRFSYLTVDRASSPDRLIAGEYCDTGTTNGRLVAYPMADAVPGSGSTLQVSSSWALPSDKVQGAAFDGTSWYFNRSYGDEQGTLIKANTAMGVVSTTPAPYRAEDLSLWRLPKELWSVTDGKDPADRMVYRMTAAQL